jgi:hypothetical protein
MIRAIALALALAVLAWQVANAARGRFVHRYLFADLVASLVLIAGAVCRSQRCASVVMLVGFSALSAVFFAATSGGLLVDGYRTTGTALTTLGLVPSLTCAAVLARGLCRTDPKEPPTRG